MKRERRTLSSGVSRIESRFAELDETQRRLENRKTVSGSRRTLRNDPIIEEPVFTSADVQSGEAKSYKATQVIRTGESAVRSCVHDKIAHNLTSLKSQVQTFLTQQRQMKTLPVDTAAEYVGTPRDENASETFPEDPDNFLELFMDERAYETRVQLGMIAKMTAAKPSHQPNPTAKLGTRPPVIPTQTAPLPPVRQQSGTSAYANPNPVQIKPGFLRNQHPKTNVTKVGKREVPKQSQVEPKLQAPVREAVRAPIDVVYTKEFYHLHVRILHSISKLEAWEFDVVITDITFPSATKRHSIRNLRINPSMYLIFHPPNGVVLSPVDDIPWAASPEALFEHTLRIEVYSTYPSRTQVIDNVVYFGDTAPLEMNV